MFVFPFGLRAFVQWLMTLEEVKAGALRFWVVGPDIDKLPMALLGHSLQRPCIATVMREFTIWYGPALVRHKFFLSLDGWHDLMAVPLVQQVFRSEYPVSDINILARQRVDSICDSDADMPADQEDRQSAMEIYFGMFIVPDFPDDDNPLI